MPDQHEGDPMSDKAIASPRLLFRLITEADPGPEHPVAIRQQSILAHVVNISPELSDVAVSLVRQHNFLMFLDGMYDLRGPRNTDSRNAESSARVLHPLLKEYTEKYKQAILDIRKAQDAYYMAGSTSSAGSLPPQIRSNRATSDFQSLRFAIQRLKLSADNLIRHASQLVEHGKLELPTRLKLGLQLAEFETQVRYAEQLIASGPHG